MSSTLPMTDAGDLTVWMQERQRHFEALAERSLPQPDIQPLELHQAMRYAVLDGGKRMRPLLAYAAGRLAGAQEAVLDAVALALECIHAYSLVHDDLPCMDNDVLRRGKPTVHVKFGEAGAMLAGDALQAQAFLVLSQAPAQAPQLITLVRYLAEASGSSGMCGGQALDLAAQNHQLDEAALELMHGKKTGALLKAAVMMGASSGSLLPAQLAHLDRYATALGLAFQVVDDILDVESSSAELGKTPGKDQQNNKPTYVSTMGLEQAKARATQLLSEAIQALHDTGLSAERLLRLEQLARLVVERRH